MRKSTGKLWLVSAALLAVSWSASANDELLLMEKNAADWVMPTGQYNNQRYSELAQINSSNVGDLQVAWTFSTGVLRGHEGGPLVIGDMMYVHTPFPNNVYALDLNQDGKIVWSYHPKQDPDTIPVMCCDTVNRGLSYADGKIILHQADTTVVALNSPAPVTSSGKPSTAIRSAARPAPPPSWWSRTRSSSASPVASSACAAA